MATITTPRVRIKAQESEAQFTNATSNPTHFVALTTQGPLIDDEVYTTVNRFKEIYGGEIVPDNTLSNIERALTLGSKVRVFRVASTNTVSDWVDAINKSFDYEDTYQLILSHIHQHLVDTYQTPYATAIELAAKFQDRILFIEIPKNLVDVDSATVWKSALATSVGGINSPYVAWFAGGIKYISDGNSNTVDNLDNLGTVAGLADNALEGYGAWKSFSGIVRGIVKDGIGVGMQNKQTPFSDSVMQVYADNRINLFILKTNKELNLYTKPTLWHNFTSYVATDGNNFMSYIYNVRLLIYVKKQLIPLLENYLEEPNTFSTWSLIASQGQDILQNLVTEGAISAATWEGDQSASNYSDLQINNETDVRNGIYKVKVSITEQILMQNIGFILTLDNHNGNIIINDLI